MAEYINKAELIEKIKANEYMLTDVCNSRSKGMFTIGIQQACDELPTIEIIHCRECLYEDHGMCSHIDHEWERHEEDYYCADGARKPAMKPALKHADREILQSAT